VVHVLRVSSTTKILFSWHPKTDGDVSEAHHPGNDARNMSNSNSNSTHQQTQPSFVGGTLKEQDLN
jgi:hypothetical protein